MSKTQNLNKSKKYDDFFISSISIDGLFSRYNLHWELNDDVNILVGKNGSGKSTLVNLIKSSSDIKNNQAKENINAEINLLKNKFSEFRLKLKNKISIKTANQKGLPNEFLDMVKKELEKIKDQGEVKEWINLELLKNVDFSKLGDGLLTEIKVPNFEKENINTSKIEENININIISTFDTLILSKKEYDSRSDTVFSQLDFVLEKETEKLKSLIILNQNKSSKEYSSLDSKKKRKGNAFKEINDSNFSQISEFEKQMNYFLSENGKSLKINNGDINIIQDNKVIPHEQLSSGEKQLLFILLNVLNSTNKPTVLVLDEPELSLHLSWQEKLIAAIRSIHPQLQLIITTHSPAIVMKGWMSKMTDIKSLLTEIKPEKEFV